MNSLTIQKSRVKEVKGFFKALGKSVMVAVKFGSTVIINHKILYYDEHLTDVPYGEEFIIKVYR